MTSPIFTANRVRKAGVLSAALAGLWMLVAVSPAPSSSLGCLPDAQVATPATPVSDPTASCDQAVSWQTWVFGQPRSMQFHFYDLLELLYGGESDSRWSSGHGQ